MALQPYREIKLLYGRVHQSTPRMPCTPPPSKYRLLEPGNTLVFTKTRLNALYLAETC